MYLSMGITEEAAEFVALTMRSTDQREVALLHHTPHSAVYASWADSELDAVLWGDGGAPLAVGGVISMHDGVTSEPGAIWMLGSDRLNEVLRTNSGRYSFMHNTKTMLAYWQERFDALYNWSDAKNTASHRWLKWLGFELDDPAPFGPSCALFRHFHWRRS